MMKTTRCLLLSVLLCLLSSRALLTRYAPRPPLYEAPSSPYHRCGRGGGGGVAPLHASGARLTLPLSFYPPQSLPLGANVTAAAAAPKRLAESRASAESDNVYIDGVDRCKIKQPLQALTALIRSGRTELFVEGGFGGGSANASSVTNAELNYLATKSIHALGAQGGDDAAAEVFAALQAHPRASVDTFTLSAMMAAYMRARKFNKSMMLFDNLTSPGQTTFDIYTYNGYLQSAGSVRDFPFMLQCLERAYVLFGADSISCVDTVLTNLKFAGTDNGAAIARAHDLITWLHTRGLAHSERTLDILLNVACSRCGEDVAEVDRVMAIMELHGVRPGRYTLNTLLNKCTELQDARGAAHMVDLMARWGYRSDAVTYNTLLKLFIASRDVSGAQAVLQSMHCESIEYSDYTRSLLIQLNSIAPAGKKEDVMSLLSSNRGDDGVTPHMFAGAISSCGDYRAALRLLQRAINARKADAAVYTAAAQVCGRCNEYESAFRVMDIMAGRGIEMNRLSLSLAISLCLDCPRNSIKRLQKYLGLARSSSPSLVSSDICQRVMARLTAAGSGLAACNLHLGPLAHLTCKTEVLEQLFANMQLESAAGSVDGSSAEDSSAEGSSGVAVKALALLGMYALGEGSRHLLRTAHFNSVLRLLSLADMHAQSKGLFKLMAGESGGSSGEGEGQLLQVLSSAWTWRPSTFTIAELVRCSKEAADPSFTARVVSWACRCGTFVPDGVVSDAVSFAYGTGRTDLARSMYEELYRGGSVSHWKDRQEMQMDLHAFSRGMAFAAISSALDELRSSSGRRRGRDVVLTVITGKSTSRSEAETVQQGGAAGGGFVVSEEVQRVLTEDFFPPIDSSTVPGNSGRLTIRFRSDV